MIGSVEQELTRVVKTDGAAHLTLIDPDSQSPEKAGEIAEAAYDGGTDAIMVGGSVGATGILLEETVKEIKKRAELPVILFPSSSAGLCKSADAVFFMSLLNSRDNSYLIGNQALGAPLVMKYELEPIPMAYLILEPGGTVGWVGDAKKFPRDKPEITMAYALAGRYFGMRFVYLEAGSGADKPVPTEIVSKVKSALGDVLLVVGGGIGNGKTASKLVTAGADLIVTGTAVERSKDVRSFVQEIAEAIKGQ